MMLFTLFLIILQASTQGQAVSPRDAAAPSGAAASISGRITELDSGAPIPRALVTLATADRSQSLETIADENGRYEFTGLAAGDVAIWAGPPELRVTHLRQVFGRTERAAERITLAENEERTLDLRVWKP